MMHKNKSVDVHQFAMVPRAEIPRSSFSRQFTHKTTFDAGYLIPIYVDEIIPGHSLKLSMAAFARLATPIFPLMDNLHMDFFFFFVPCRLVWTNWVKFMGEQTNPGDSISYTIPQCVSPTGGYAINSLQDYFGLPTVGQLGGGNTKSANNLPLRAYNLIWNTWFRSQDLQNSVTVDVGDGPDTAANYVLLRRGKRHDYITSCLPWPQKGGTAITIPLGTSAPVKGLGFSSGLSIAGGPFTGVRETGGGTRTYTTGATMRVSTEVYAEATGTGTGSFPTIYADLTAASAATINTLRLSFQIQKLLERDARGGTRYTEIVRAHFGVVSPDARLQRPEYLGGGSVPINITPIAQQTQTGVTGGATPMGTLAAVGTGLATSIGFTQSFTEHGYVIGLVSVRADLTYQQGLRRMWTRSTRYDFYFPAFAMLGEQAVRNDEIYCDGSANDTATFGFNERWGEMRYMPSMITGLFRSTAAGTIDPWHAAQKFNTLPTLNATFIQDTPPIDRIVAVGSAANGKQFLFDSFFNVQTAAPMPLYSVPGLIDHF